MERLYHCATFSPRWNSFAIAQRFYHCGQFYHRGTALSLWNVFTTAQRLYRGASLTLWNINYYVVLWNFMRKVERLSHCGVFFTIVDDHSCIFLFPKSMKTKTGPDKGCMASEMYEAPNVGYDRPPSVLSGR